MHGTDLLCAWEKGQYHLLFPLPFVRCGVCCCGAVAPRVTAALLGRFLPRLGPLARASGPFFLRAFNIGKHGFNASNPDTFADCISLPVVPCRHCNLVAMSARPAFPAGRESTPANHLQPYSAAAR